MRVRKWLYSIKKNKIKCINFIVVICILFMSIGYSVFNSNLMVDNITAVVRPTKDIRVTGVSASDFINQAMIDWVDYNVKSISSSIQLPSIDSTISFKIQITNIGGTEMGIFNITGLPDNLEYTLSDYTLKEKLCNENICSLGMQKYITITIKYKDGSPIINSSQPIKLDFDFRSFHKINYINITNNGYPEEVIDGGSLDITFNDSVKDSVIVAKKDTEDIIEFSYSNRRLVVNNVNNDLDVIQMLPQEFKYTGNYQTFKVKYPGTYQIELWGASGGNCVDYIGGNGAYTIGNIVLSNNENLYIYVGEQGHEAHLNYHATFNGGAEVGLHPFSTEIWGGTGGGATDVRLTPGIWNNFNSLKSRIMVAAGGGGASSRSYCYGNGNGGAGGKVEGLSGEIVDSTCPYGIGLGATQTSGGKSWWYDGQSISVSYFGYSGAIYAVNDCRFECDGQVANNQMFLWSNQSGGGGGYYGGGSSVHGSSGGGSSFISGYLGCVAIKESSIEGNVQPKDGCSDGTNNIICSYHYSNKVFTNTDIRAGNEVMPSPSGSTEVGHSGDGYAIITYLKN